VLSSSPLSYSTVHSTVQTVAYAVVNTDRVFMSLDLHMLRYYVVNMTQVLLLVNIRCAS